MGRILVTKYHLIALSLVGILPHSTELWNFELKAGIGMQIIANLVVAGAFVIFYSSIAELTSSFPFAGGSFAFARCTVGFYPGYLVGCIEVLYYTLLLVWTNGAMMVLLRRDSAVLWTNRNYVLVGLFVSNFVMCISKKWVYSAFAFLAVFGLCINLIYIFGSIQFLDFSRWAYLPHHTDDDTLQPFSADDDDGYVNPKNPSSGVLFNVVSRRIFEAFSTTVWTYKGLENVNLMSEDVVTPRSMIPLAQMIGMAALVLFNTSIPVIGASMYPGIERLIKLPSPNSPGLAQIFNVTHSTANYVLLPMLYGMSTVTCYSLTKLIAAMAESRLFPKVLARRVWNTQTPIFALGSACITAMIVVVALGLTAPKDFLHFSTIIGVYAVLTYCMQLVSFIVLRLKLSPFPREFRSPFGILGAIVCMVVFLAGIACALSIGHRTIPAIAVGLIYVAAVSVYYFWFAKHSQAFSEDEKAVILPAHVGIRNANEYFYSKFPCLGALVSVFFKDRQLKGRFQFCKRSKKVVPAAPLNIREREVPRMPSPLTKRQQEPATQDGQLVMEHPLVFVAHEQNIQNGNFQSGTSETSAYCNNFPTNRKSQVENFAVQDSLIHNSYDPDSVRCSADSSYVLHASRSSVFDLKSSCSCVHEIQSSAQEESPPNAVFGADDSQWHIVDLHPLQTDWENNTIEQQPKEYLLQDVRGFESSLNVDVDLFSNS